MVAGDHHGADAAPLGVGHRLNGLRSGRVDHGDQADEGIVPLILQGDLPGSRHPPKGEGQHPQPLAGQSLVHRQDLRPPLLCQLYNPIGGEQAHRPVQQYVQGPLGEHHRLPLLQHVEGGHELPVGVKGQLAQTGVLGPVGPLLDAHAVADHNEGHLGGVAHGGSLLLVGGGVAGQDGGPDQPPVNGVLQRQLLAGNELPVYKGGLGGHFVLGEGARLVRTDHRHRPQGLHRLELLHDGVLLGHLLGAHGLDDGDNGAEGLGDGGHRQGHGEHEGVQDGLGAEPSRVVQGQGEHAHADDEDDHGQPAAELVQALLERSLAPLGLVHQGGHLSQLGVHAGAGDHHQGPAIGDQRAGEHQVFPVPKGHLVPLNDRLGLLHPLALAGEGALVHFQGVVMQNAAVGHHHIPRLQLHNIAGDDLGGGDHQPLSVPKHPGGGGGHGLQALQGFFRLAVLDGAQHRVEDQHRKDDNGALHIAGQHGDHSGGNENHHQQVLELLQEHLPHRLLFLLPQRVGAESLQPLLSLTGSEALLPALHGR